MVLDQIDHWKSHNIRYQPRKKEEQKINTFNHQVSLDLHRLALHPEMLKTAKVAINRLDSLKITSGRNYILFSLSDSMFLTIHYTISE
jgi:hypothetical protein